MRKQILLLGERFIFEFRFERRYNRLHIVIGWRRNYKKKEPPKQLQAGI